jgi:hypothetical protein
MGDKAMVRDCWVNALGILAIGGGTRDNYVEVTNDGYAWYITAVRQPSTIPASVMTGTGSASSTGVGAAASVFRGGANFGDFNAGGWGNNFALPSWIRYDFGAGNSQTLTGYAIFNTAFSGILYPYTANYSPKSWTFEGSNDNSTWTTLDTQSNQLIVLGAPPAVYTFANVTAYRYYRLNVSVAHTAGGFVTVVQMYFLTATGLLL